MKRIAAQLFNDAEKAERARKDSMAANAYRSLLVAFSRTKYISSGMKSTVQDPIQKIDARITGTGSDPWPNLGLVSA